MRPPRLGKDLHSVASSTPNGKAVLHRTTFRTDRRMDFFSEKELTTQTGHQRSEWPLVIIKELVDNALDACEESDIAPVITVEADATGITVKDNGPGLPESTIESALDFTVRASSNEAYVSPARGAQGNALKTLIPMPRILDPEQGKFIIQAHGKQHIIVCAFDPISQRPHIRDDVTDAKCKKSRSSTHEKASFGTKIRIEWAEMSSLEEAIWPFGGDRPDWIRDPVTVLVEGYSIFNPHATVTLDWFGQRATWMATDPEWEKWKPNKPTSSHWYEQKHFERLVGAYITHDRDAGKDRFVSDFIAEFDGLAGSKKRSKVLDDVGLRRVALSAMVTDAGLDSDRLATLLAAMQKHTHPVSPQRLGIVGEDHLRTRLLAMGVQPDSFRYSRKLSKDRLPCVLEAAFGWLGEDAGDNRRIYSGANWSAAIKNPFRSFGTTSEGLETALANMKATRNEPVVFVLHLAHPRIEYVDRGKSAMVIGGAA